MATQPRNDSTGKYRRILDGFGHGSIQGTEDLPIDPTVDDGKTLAIALVVALGVLSAPGPLPLLAIGAATVLALGLTVIYVSPDDRAPHKWLSSIARFKATPDRLTAHSEHPDLRTQGLTGIDRVLPSNSAIERRDGALVGLVEIEGRDMALAEKSVWEQASAEFEGLNESVDSGIDIYSPARTVDPGRLAKGYIGREKDEDVRRSDTLAELVETYQDELPAEFRRRGTAVRRFYVVLTVTESEVRREGRDVLAQLADLPVVGAPVRRFGLSRGGPTPEEIDVRQKSILSARKRAVRNGVSGIEECDSKEVDGEHLAATIKEYWTGIRVPHDGKPVPKHGIPVVKKGTVDDGDPAATGGY